MVRSASACSAEGRWRAWLCVLALLVLVAQLSAPLHAVGHAQSEASASKADAALADSSTDQSAPDPGAEACGLCLAFAVLAAAALPWLRRWRFAPLGQASPRGPPACGLAAHGQWAVQARAPPGSLSLTA